MLTLGREARDDTCFSRTAAQRTGSLPSRPLHASVPPIYVERRGDRCPSFCLPAPSILQGFETAIERNLGRNGGARENI